MPFQSTRGRQLHRSTRVGDAVRKFVAAFAKAEKRVWALAEECLRLEQVWGVQIVCIRPAGISMSHHCLSIEKPYVW